MSVHGNNPNGINRKQTNTQPKRKSAEKQIITKSEMLRGQIISGKLLFERRRRFVIFLARFTTAFYLISVNHVAV